MKHLPISVCEICGKPKGRGYNHAACSKIKQKMHEKDARPQIHEITQKKADFLAKRYGS